MLLKLEVESFEEVKSLCSLYDVIFEECVLESDEIYYSISKITCLKLYDVVIINKKSGRLINVESRAKLSGSTLKYFNNYAGDVYVDAHGNTFKCKSHYVIYR